ncbi:MAG: PAS domain S-box protein [Burkholderiaceae bacterium]|nr:PAS domain S-box protein [Burkholderiaceae bacterium]
MTDQAIEQGLGSKPLASPPNVAVTTLLLSLAYVISGKLSLLLAIPPGYASPIFPPAGVAVAAAFIMGRRAAAGILLGSFLLNLWIGHESAHQFSLLGSSAAFLIALASMTQALAGSVMLRRTVGYPVALDNMRDVLLFLLLSPVICVISATLSVSCLVILGLVSTDAFPLSWAMWWVGDTLGVLVLLPLTLIAAGEPRALWRKRAATVAAPMLFAFVMLVLLYINASKWELADAMGEFHLQSQRFADTIQARLDEQETLLEQTEGLFASDKDVSAEEFHRFTQEALKHFPMIQAIEWAPRVDDANRRSYEAAQRVRLPDFTIRERKNDRELRQAGIRQTYFPITFVEPYEGNESVFGLDLYANKERAEAVDLATRTDRGVATAPLRLIQAPNKPYGFLLLHAAKSFRSNDGVVLTVIRIDDFLDKLLPSDKGLLWLRLTDIGTGQTVFNTFNAPTDPAAWSQQLVYGGRLFQFDTTPSPAYLAQHHGWQSSVVLAAGLFGIGLLGAFLMLGTGYAARMEAQVKEKVAELTENTEKLTGLYELSPLGIALTDMEGRYIEFNEAFVRICGYPEAELKDLDYWALTPRKYEAEEAAQLESLRSKGRYGPYEKEYVRKDGSLVPISLNGLLISGRKGDKFIWSIVEDISQRKHSEEALRESEQRWKFALEGAGDGMWDLNLQTGALFLSSQALAILGYEGEEARSTTAGEWTAKHHPDDQARRQVALDEYFSGKVPYYRREYRTRSRDGRWKWVMTRGMLVSRSADGKPLRMIGTHTDIDTKKREENQEAVHSAVMEMLARGGKMRELLDKVIAGLEAENPELFYAVLNIGDGKMRMLAASLPLYWLERMQISDLGPKTGGIASFKGKRLERPPTGGTYWSSLSAMARSSGFELCWSEAIVSGGQEVEGTLVSFRKQSSSDTLPDLAEQQQAANLMSIAIQRKREQEQLQLANSVYESSNEAIMVVNSDNHIVAVNPAFERITGYSEEEVLGRNPKLLQSGRQSVAFFEAMWHSIRETGSWRGELWNRRKDGEIYPQQMSISTIFDEDGRVLRRIAVLDDITEKKRAEERIHHMAHHDLLTGLPNRQLYSDRLNQSLATARRQQSRIGVLYIDLDKFKPINDSLGHAVGDQVLQMAAKRMLDCVRESDTVARIGGDEFVVLLPTIQSESDARIVAEKIRAVLEVPFECDGHSLGISSSIGGAVYPEQGMDEQQLMESADRAMYESKKSGRNMVRFAGVGIS